MPVTEALLPDGVELTESKRRLFECAITLIGDRGYHGVSVRDLADALGIKPPSLYAHVASKQELLYELILIGNIAYRDRLRAALLDCGPDPEEQLRAIMREHVLMPLESPALTRICSRELRSLDDEHLAPISAIREETAAVFLEVVGRGAAAGVFTVSDPMRAMRAIADMGFRLSEWPLPEGEPEQIVEDYCDFARRLLS